MDKETKYIMLSSIYHRDFHVDGMIKNEYLECLHNLHKLGYIKVKLNGYHDITDEPDYDMIWLTSLGLSELRKLKKVLI